MSCIWKPQSILNVQSEYNYVVAYFIHELHCLNRETVHERVNVMYLEATEHLECAE